jgi:hypothetical protein
MTHHKLESWLSNHNHSTELASTAPKNWWKTWPKATRLDNVRSGIKEVRPCKYVEPTDHVKGGGSNDHSPKKKSYSYTNKILTGCDPRDSVKVQH